ncbi:4-hydroxythreonine-4-phosphate dehydrogenase [Hydrogenispora ethanolica]|jgi:4-hydroxythreonine-4-phosphate dehydrogenase|uniref:4-hydroxythreonine-4-phosphate dehydrogenase n=1 Tax=Hydrogenispora ethanolica TaxID=1082276 RepID=A0A4R1RU02_HYDET|nr:4-hydroxythreonine-4-phosphate dehydrogenase PdxA [Hydrogenispora ethanolica]TCL70035.1 4-hydroxythreonine-4-phosphate dehydrogenase [Hydrogenispora ethanolica]
MKQQMKQQWIAVTMGDPAGVGAEVTVKALQELAGKLPAGLLVIGDSRFIRQAVAVCGLAMPVKSVAALDGVEPEAGSITVLDLGNADPALIPYGQISPLAGRAAYQYLESAIGLALEQKVAAVVTAPLNKAALNQAGHHYSGHTEIFARLTGAADYAMMLAEGSFRVVHVTTHVALRKACDLVTRERVYRVIKLAYAAGQQLKLPRIRIGVAGLNPHSGEGGLFGDEELREIIPAIERAAAEGIAVEGPVPPDTVFVKARSGIYDFAIAMYHDQGHIPLKLAGFTCDGGSMNIAGVNVTLGLPIIRTSVDHGTAFDQAGRGTASAQSMVDAIRLAVRLAGLAEGA